MTIKNDNISELRHTARTLIRELGLLNFNSNRSNRTAKEWHTLIEIQHTPDITLAKLSQLLLFSPSRMSRIVNALIKESLVKVRDGLDKREKYLQITAKGINEIKRIDEYSNIKIRGALTFLSENDRQQIINAMQKYSDALKMNRLTQEKIKIHTLSTSRVIRQQIINMIENIQTDEFGLNIPKDLNTGVLRAEKEYYYHNSYNFWYAIDEKGIIVGSLGLKKIDSINGEIKKFFVSKDYRGRGVALKLMHYLVKASLKHGFKSLYLGTVDTLKSAQSFYEKHGFSKIKQTTLPHNFEKCSLDNVFYKIKCSDLQNDLLSQIQE